MEIAIKKHLLVKGEEAQSHPSQIHSAPDHLVKMIASKQAAVQESNDGPVHLTTKKPDQKLANKTVKVQTKPQKETIQVEDISKKKLKSLKPREQQLLKRKGFPVETIQSKSVKVQNIFGVVTPIEKTETVKEGLKVNISVAPVMGIANEKHLLVKEEEAKSHTLQTHVALDNLVQDIKSKQEEVLESPDGPVDTVRSTNKSEQKLANIPERVKEVQSKVVIIEDLTGKVIPPLEDQTGEIRGSVEQPTPDVTTTLDVQTGNKLQTAKVIKVNIKTQKGPIQGVDISPMKLKLIEFPVETIQSKTMKVQNVFGIITPIEQKEPDLEQLQIKVSMASDMGLANKKCISGKVEGAKSDTSRIHVAPVDLDPKIPEIIFEGVWSKVVTIEDQTKIINNDDQTGQMIPTVEGKAAKEPEYCEVIKYQTKPQGQSDQVEKISPMKLNLLNQREQELSKLKDLPVETIQSKTERVKNTFGIVIPIEKAETELKGNVSVAPVMEITNADEGDKSHTLQINVAPDDILNYIVSKQEIELGQVSPVGSLRMLKSTNKSDQEFGLGELQSKVVTLEDQTYEIEKVRPGVGQTVLFNNVKFSKERDHKTKITNKIIVCENQPLIDSIASVTDSTKQKEVQDLQYESKTEEKYPSGMKIQRSSLGAELEEVHKDAPLQRAHSICKQEDKKTIFPLGKKGENKSLPVGASSKGRDGKHLMSPIV